MGENFQVPVAYVQNPLLLWLFKHGWEDPGWGQAAINQIVLGLVLYDLGARIANSALKEQVQATAQKVVAENAKHITG